MSPARWRALCMSVLFAAAGLAHAEGALTGAPSTAAAARAPSGGQAALMPYEVRAGDTLYHLAQRYLESPEDWRVLARLNLSLIHI